LSFYGNGAVPPRFPLEAPRRFLGDGEVSPPSCSFPPFPCLRCPRPTIWPFSTRDDRPFFFPLWLAFFAERADPRYVLLGVAVSFFFGFFLVATFFSNSFFLTTKRVSLLRLFPLGKTTPFSAFGMPAIFPSLN